MSKSLALIYRPKTFDDVVGQDIAKKILQSLIKNDDIKNCYLFAGKSGSGKTTCARIYANEIIKKYNGVIIEINAASNNGVEDVRGMIEEAKKQVLSGGYKIFILDECHLLSNSAFGALLKLLEEPPQKSIFILCTTDPQKLPNTIKNRLYQINFNKIGATLIFARLKYIIQLENEKLKAELEGNFSGDINDEDYYIQYEEEAIKLIAKLANGGMRDAITYIDKMLLYSKYIKVDGVKRVLSVLSDDDFLDLYLYIQNKDISNIYKKLKYIDNVGINLLSVMEQFLEFLINIYVSYIDDSSMIVSINYKRLLEIVDLLVGIIPNIKYSNSQINYILGVFIK